MFGRKHKKLVYHREERVTYLVLIEGVDEEEEARTVKDLVKDFSVNKRIFAEINGDMSAIGKEAIVHMEDHPRNRFCKKVEIFPEKIENINFLELQENMWTCFYFFCDPVTWEEFIEIKKIHPHFKRGDLAAMIYLHNTDGIRIETGKNESYPMKELLRRLQEEGYFIKKF